VLELPEVMCANNGIASIEEWSIQMDASLLNIVPTMRKISEPMDEGARNDNGK
jgi:hypothetical protein